jgi:hypothetical protein
MKNFKYCLQLGIELVLLSIALNAQQVFQPTCGQFPEQIASAHQQRRIDKLCTAAFGDIPANDLNHRKQNEHKNDFCVSGTPIDITRDLFLQLHAAAKQKHIKFGDRINLPDRAGLSDILTVQGRTIGEGTLVRYVALIDEARHSSLGGESVNCGKKGPANNDVHLDLVRNFDEDSCDSVTAEMSPHFRPSAWHRLAGTGSTKKRETPLAHNPVRITGPLFFDASHVSCQENLDTNPARVSVWEIHPVYSIDVCSETEISNCPANNESLWTPLTEWEP